MKNNASTGKRMLYFTKSISLALFLTFVLSDTVVAATSYAENRLSTIALHGQPLKKVVEYVEKNSDFVFIWETNVDLDREVNVDVQNKTIREILNQMFVGTGLEYHINGKQVIIRQAQQDASRQTSDREKTVNGVVTDANGVPLIGASVAVKGERGKGAITDMDGKFALSGISDTDVLQFSYIGYLPQEVKVGGRSVFNMVLEEDAKVLGEVVVTALGIKREEKALGYSVQKVSGEKLTAVKPVNIATSLTGKVAGLNISNSTEFNGSPSISLRGESPLIVIDGVPYANISLNDIAPEDVESIDVLKGATASALYGARGGSGAIMVTTKRGGKDGLEISVSNNTMFNAGYLRKPEVQKSYSSGINGQYNDNASYVWGAKLDAGLEAMQYNPFTGEREMTPLTSRGKDNLKNFQQLSLITNSNVNVAYKGEHGSFRTSLTHVFNKGQFPNERLNKINYTVSGNMNFGKFSAEGGVTYNRRFYPNMSNPAYDGGKSYLYQILVWSGAEYDIRDYKNYWKVKDQESHWWDRGNWYENPWYVANEVTESNTYDVVNAFANASYEFMPWLKLSFRSGVDMYTSKSESKVPIGSRAGTGDMKGYYGISRSTGFSTNNDLILTAEKQWGDFSVDGFIGGTLYYWQSDNLSSHTAGGLLVPGYYSLNASVDPAETSKSYSSKQVNSLYGKVGASYKSLAFVEVTGRNDWSSTLPAETRSYFYPAVSGSLILSEIFQLPKALSFWKLRGSWTTTKHDMSVYAINEYYSISKDVWDQMSGASVSSTLRNSLLSPSQTRSYEIGTAIHVLNNRLRVDYTYYNTLKFNNTRTATLSKPSGYTGTQVNMDEEQMRMGHEITITGDIIKNEDMNWTAQFNWARDRYVYHKIDPQYSTQKPWVAEGERWDWVAIYDYQRDAEGNIIHGSDGLPLVNPFTSVIGYSSPDWTWGLNTTFSWKGLTVNIGIDGSVGGIGYDMISQAMWNSGAHIDSDNMYRYEEVMNGNQTFVGPGVKLVSGEAKWDADGNVLSDNRVFAPNDIVVSYQNYMMKTNPYASGGNKRRQNYFDKTYIKLRDISISYALPKHICEKLGTKGLSVGFTGQNLLMWSKEFRFSDPEYVSAALSSPSIRYMGFSVRADF